MPAGAAPSDTFQSPDLSLWAVLLSARPRLKQAAQGKHTIAPHLPLLLTCKMHCQEGSKGMT